MHAIYNNEGRMLGHINGGDYIDGRTCITVCEDVKLKPYDPEAQINMSDMTSNIYRIAKQEVIFRCMDDEVRYLYLVIDCEIPAWFWNNLGCVEFKSENFKRIPG